MRLPVLTAVRQTIASHKALSAIVLLGFGLRVASLFWGVPLTSPHYDSEARGYYNPDECTVFGQAVGFPWNYLRNPPYAYGSTIPYGVALVCFPFKSLVLRKLAYELLVVLACRLGSVLAGTGTILLVYHLGRRFSGALGGLLAAALLCVSFTHVLNSCYCNLDIWIGFLVLLNFAYLFHIFDFPGPRLKQFLILGALSGALIGTKVTTGIFFVAPIGLCLLAGVRDRVALRWLWLLLAYASAAGTVYAVTNMHILVQLREYLTFMRDLKRDWYDSHPQSAAQVVANWVAITRLAVGTPTPVLACVGALLWGRKELAYKLCLLSFVGLHYSLFLNYFQPRYVATIAPILCLLAGGLCARCLASVRLPVRLLGGYATAVAVICSGACCASGLYYRWHDPRDEARAFFLAHVPAGCTFALADTDRGHGEWQYPPLEAEWYTKTELTGEPDLILVAREHGEIVRALFNQRLVGDDYSLNEAGRKAWVPNRPQPASYFRRYRELLDETGDYQLVHVCAPPRGLPPEYSSHGLWIFARTDKVRTLGLGTSPKAVAIGSEQGR